MIFQKEAKTGLVIGNSTMSAAVTGRGRLFGRLQYNPPCFEWSGNALRDAGECGFEFETAGQTCRDCDLDWNVLEHTYPCYRAETVLPEGTRLNVLAFSPLSARDEETIFTPCAVTEFTFSNPDSQERHIKLTIEWHPTKDALRGSFGKKGTVNRIGSGQYLLDQGDAFLSAFGCEGCEGAVLDGGQMRLTANVKLRPMAQTQCVFLLGIFEPEHRFRTKFETSSDVCRYVAVDYARIRDDLFDFLACVPNVGDEQIYRYTRWYMQAAILLTKSARTGEVMTMGYTELNQRDSFWTSFVHVSLWSGLEKEILRVSARWMRPDGKIPTTVLPRIERHFDIDINEYFCLRIARYHRYHRDLGFLEEMYGFYRRSVEFLLTFDRDGDGVPEQDTPDNPLSFWGDWKDVPGVSGRKLAPHFALLWLAVLKEGAWLAGEMEDLASKSWYESLYDRAYEAINRPVTEGGMWQEDHYAEVWYDGRPMTEVLQDQVVGMIWGVVPAERIGSIYGALNRGENAFGIPETWPYRPDSFGYEGGDYHNGGIWPYLMFCDIMSRYRNGFASDAERLIRKVGHQDLEVPGDFAPNEYLHGTTGENRGMEIQGWSSALYGAITHGTFRVEHTGAREITVKINFPDRDFETILVLPKRFGRVTLSRKNGVISLSGVRDGYTVKVKENRS